MNPRSKSRITLSLSSELVSFVDGLVKERVSSSRSAIVEDALGRWHQQYRLQELDHQTELYYQSMTEQEWQDDREWTQITGQAAQNLWNATDSPVVGRGNRPHRFQHPLRKPSPHRESQPGSSAPPAWRPIYLTKPIS